jgi:hypothetical protein
MAASPSAADWSLADACLDMGDPDPPHPPPHPHGDADAGDLADGEDEDEPDAPPRAVRRLSHPPEQPPSDAAAAAAPGAETPPQPAPLMKPEEGAASAVAVAAGVLAPVADCGAQSPVADVAAAAVGTKEAGAGGVSVKTEAMTDGEDDGREDVAAAGTSEDAPAAGTNIFKYMSYETASDPAARRQVLKSLAASLAGGCGSKRPRPASPPPPGRYPLTSAELLFLAAGSPAAAAAAKAAALPGSGA